MMSGEYKQLYRSSSEQMIAGVCGGLAKYFNMDPTVVRLLSVAAAFYNPPGAVLAYLLVMLIVPEEPVNETSVG
jgi:phage shock protein C